MSQREYDRLYEKLVKAGYSPAAAHARAAKVTKLVADSRITTADNLPARDWREHDAYVYTTALKRMLGVGFPRDLAEERADREATEAARRVRYPSARQQP